MIKIKKKGVLLGLVCLLLFFFIVHSGAVLSPDFTSFFPTDWPPYYDFWGYSKDDYDDNMERYVEGHIPNASDKDISPDRLEFLGIFDRYHMCVPMEKYCDQVYRGEEVAWKYEYEFEMSRTETEIYTAVIEIRHYGMEKIEATCSLDALAEPSDMRLLDAAYHGEKQNIRLGSARSGAIYHYVKEGCLRWIKWGDDKHTFTLTVDTLEHVRDSYWWNREGDFSSYEGEGIVADLLNSKTAKGALWEFRARVAFGAISDEVYIDIAVCTVVIALVITLVITYLVMRKKRGALAPAPAMAGIPTGEVSAGSDVDVSVAPAAPESPTPPESSTPPEEDTKTDDFDRS